MRASFFGLVFLSFAFPNLVEARPAHKLALAQYFGPFLPRKLNDCRTCHLPDKTDRPAVEQDYEKPHNAFGARLKTVRGELRKAGKSTTLEARLDAILDEDSDGDGVSNLLEILTGHFPGDKDDRPTDAELAEAKQKLVAFAKFRKGYPWRPFATIERPAVPKVKNEAWVRNPIDAFIALEHEALGLKPRPEASKPVLLRRVYIDLIGLPPTPEDLHTFLDDTAPDAYEKVIDRLLNSPHYGERWGRHWMDIWRYSDWAGFGPEVRDSQPHIWRWRDWIVESLNADKGYDRMLLEMLAGDELAPEDPKILAATGYLVRNWKRNSREKWLQDTVEHTFMAFQGVTIGCAKCHDHMYDAILQREYYQVRAIFEPHNIRTDRLPGQGDIKLDGVARAYDADLKALTHLFIRGDDRTPDKSKALTPAVPEVLGGNFPAIAAIDLPRLAHQPDKRAFVVEETIKAGEEEIKKAGDALKRHDLSLQAARFLPDYSSRLVFAARILKSHEDRNLLHLEWSLGGARRQALMHLLAIEKMEAQPGQDPAWESTATKANAAQRQIALFEAHKKRALSQQALRTVTAPEKRAAAQKEHEAAEKEIANAEADLKLPPSTTFTQRNSASYPAQSTGRRMAFAKWLADPENPLTARVAMNHIWARHFGQGIVPSVFDFGRNGRPPIHPALLDWLAAEFMERGWSMKAMHRLIVTSNAYRMASTPDAADIALDRDNKYLWRYPSRRVEAEVVRDSIFHIAGKLDLTMGGPDIDYPLGLTVPRRSFYFRHAAEKQMEFLALFDAASVTECYERKQAIVPQQALALINSDLTLTHARLLARKITEKTKDDAKQFTVAAFEHVLARPPTTAELEECISFVQSQTKRLEAKVGAANRGEPNGSVGATQPALRARENLVHALMNHHEFVTIR